jgi:type IV pilus assembly protein PilE
MQSTLKKSLGFTLIELVIAIVIVAILAAIAIPAYSSYVLQSHRTDAKTALLDMASLEERYFSVNNAYSTAATDLGYAAYPTTVGGGYYQVQAPTVVGATTTAAATYTLSAVAVGTQLNDTQCQTFTLTSTGVQTAAPDITNSCWH